MKTSISLPSRFAATRRRLLDPATPPARCPGLVRFGVAATALLLLTPIGAVRAQNTHFESAISKSNLPGFQVGEQAIAIMVAEIATVDDETATPEQADAVAGPMSPEGKQMLMVSLGLMGLLIGMERVCSWRLGVCQRRDCAAHKLLTPVIPPLPVIVPPLPAI